METEKLLIEWKKVTLADLDYVSDGVRKLITTPCMVFLEGKMGAGKTTFLQSFFPWSKVISPTYSLVNEMGSMAHGDFCRIEDIAELVHLEIPLYLDHKDYFFLEWGRRFYSYLSGHLEPTWSIYQLDIAVSQETRHYRLSQIEE